MSRFCLKFLVVAVTTALLSACQHHQTMSAQPATMQHNAVGTSGTSLSDQAKARLIRAVQEHLGQEYHAVTVHRTQMLPLYQDGSLNKDADPIWGSIMKVGEFKRNHTNEQRQPYLTEFEYVGEPDTGDDVKGELPYLRYDDEKAGVSAETVSRATATTNEIYRDTDDKIAQLLDDTNELVVHFHLMFDESGAGQERPSLADEQQKSIQKQIVALQKNAQGYQVQELNAIGECLNHYVIGAKELLSSSAKTETNTELLLQNYQMCASGVVFNKTLMPATYIKEGHTKNHLNTTTELAKCQRNAIKEQRNFRLMGKTYVHDDKVYLDSYLNYARCASDVLGADTDSIKDLDSAKSELYALRYVVSDGKLSEYATYTDKYQGVTGWLDAYRDMKAQGDTPKDTKDDEPNRTFGRFGVYGNMMANMLDYIKHTPEQLNAQNLYQYNNTTITSLTHHNPTTRQTAILGSLDFESSTARQSAQFPIRLDFNAGVATADVSALLPVVALVAPKHAPLPKDIPDGLMYFKTPNELAQKIPSAVIYDAISRGVVLALSDMDSERFTPVAGQDDFAKQAGAKHTIKIQLDTKEMGQLYATIAKKVVLDLNDYVDTHPDIYPDIQADKPNRAKGIKKGDSQADKVKAMIKDFATLGMAHRSSDVGGLVQVIEGVLPFRVDTATYVYLDAQGKLIATQSMTTLHDEMHDYRLKNVAQTRYGKAVFDNHALSGQFKNAFNTPAQIDGVAWVKNAVDEYRFAQRAKNVRLSYQYENDEPKPSVKADNACANIADDIASRGGHDDVRQTAEAFKQKECATR
ncbi:MAG: hypothetical protein Q3971_00680 [Moraxella sp.]|nr:hypothetical protein [Moraxella sp.]